MALSSPVAVVTGHNGSFDDIPTAQS